jgi:hypothetical protein
MHTACLTLQADSSSREGVLLCCGSNRACSWCGSV